MKRFLFLTFIFCAFSISLLWFSKNETAASVYVPKKAEKPGKFRRSALPVRNRYIVVLNDQAVKENIGSQFDDANGDALRDNVRMIADEMAGFHGGNIHHVYAGALKGFAVEMSEAEAQELSQDARVNYIEEDGYGFARQGGSQPNPPQGLDRINQRPLPLDRFYSYTFGGVGVDVFILDSGIRVTHTDFGGRATVAQDTVDDDYNSFTPPNRDRADGGDGLDRNGHGTGVAAIVGGYQYGVAKSVNIKSVRVLHDNLSFLFSEAIAGVDWVRRNRVGTRPTVVNMSFGGAPNTAFNDAVRNLVASGVVVVGAAPNGDVSAVNDSPGGIGEAIVVSSVAVNSNLLPVIPECDLATNPNRDRRVDAYGSTIDLFAPGRTILTASAGSDFSTQTNGGTSFATPHVTGVVAAYLHRFPTATPAAVSLALTSNATMNNICNPNGPNAAYDYTQRSPNRVLYNLFF